LDDADGAADAEGEGGAGDAGGVEDGCGGPCEACGSDPVTESPDAGCGAVTAMHCLVAESSANPREAQNS